jgi:hypothetical protein
MGSPAYLFRRFFRSRLLVGADGVDLGDGGRWPWSEVTGFEVRRDRRFAPRAPSWIEVSAVMHVRSGEVVDLPALGCFDERWRKHVSGVEQRVERLNIRLWSGG